MIIIADYLSCEPYFCLKNKKPMNFHFDYGELIGRMKMLSSYEGRNSIAGDGTSNYLKVKITEQDEPVVKEHISDAALRIEENIASAVHSSEYSETGFGWDLKLDTPRWNNRRSLSKYIEEAVVAYAMLKWVEENRPERVAAYSEIWNDMISRVVECVFRLNAPVKRKRRKDCVCQAEITVE